MKKIEATPSDLLILLRIFRKREQHVIVLIDGERLAFPTLVDAFEYIEQYCLEADRHHTTASTKK